MQHINCAVFAELSRFPLARMEEADRVNADADRLRDEHLSEALRLGVPLIDEGGSGFPGFLKPRPIGGSAEAGIGAFFEGMAIVEDDLFKKIHGAPQIDARSLDDRFANLADWYRGRAAQMTIRYEAARCAELL